MALERIKVRGFKSIRKLDLELQTINVLIGANGSGKSNFLEVFPLIHAVRLGREARYSAIRGGADRALHFGSKRTSEIRIELRLSEAIEYAAVLIPTDEDRLLTVEETLSDDEGVEIDLLFPADDEGEIERDLDGIMAKWRAYQFHDTSSRSPIALVRDHRRLRMAPIWLRICTAKKHAESPTGAYSAHGGSVSIGFRART